MTLDMLLAGWASFAAFIRSVWDAVAAVVATPLGLAVMGVVAGVAAVAVLMPSDRR